jgi:hypothetical protein
MQRELLAREKERKEKELRELARQQRAEKRQLGKAVERVKEGLAQLLYRGLVDDEPGAWRLLGLKMSYHLTHANTKDKDTDQLRLLICQDIVGRMLPYDPSSEAGLINDLNRQLDEMGMRRSLVLVDDGTIGYQEHEESVAAQIPQF